MLPNREPKKRAHRDRRRGKPQGKPAPHSSLHLGSNAIRGRWESKEDGFGPKKEKKEKKNSRAKVKKSVILSVVRRGRKGKGEERTYLGRKKGGRWRVCMSDHWGNQSEIKLYKQGPQGAQGNGDRKSKSEKKTHYFAHEIHLREKSQSFGKVASKGRRVMAQYRQKDWEQRGWERKSTSKRKRRYYLSYPSGRKKELE